MSKARLKRNGSDILIKVNFEGKEYSVSPVKGGKWNDSLAISKAKTICNHIDVDIETGIFNGDMSKYKYSSLFPVNQSNNELIKSEVKTSDKNNDKTPLNIESLVNRYLSTKIKDYKPNTLIDYNRLGNKLEKSPYKTTDKAKQLIIWLKGNHNGSGNKTLIKYFRILKAACRYAIAMEELTTNPFDGLEIILGKPSRKTELNDINPYDISGRDRVIQKFYEHKIGSYYAPMVEFLFLTACRPGEARAIQWCDVDLVKNKVTFRRSADVHNGVTDGTKTVRKRVMPLDSRLVTLLKKIKPATAKASDLIFPSKEGGVIDWSNFSSRVWRPVLETLPDLEYRKPYQTRHTGITLMLAVGNVNIAVVAKWVGNSPGIISKHYLGDVSDVTLPEI